MTAKELTLFFAWNLMQLSAWAERRRLSKKKWQKDNPEKVKAYTKKWNSDNRTACNEARRKWRDSRVGRSLNCMLSDKCRERMRRALLGICKSGSTLALLGGSIEQLKAHLEKQFRPGMSWQTWGLWHIDHIKPCARFDLQDPEQQKACFHFSNLQPLWAIENLQKGSK